MSRRAMVRLGRIEESSRKGKVVAAGTKRVLRDDSSQPMPLDPAQRGATVFKDTGCKPRVLTVEDPDFRNIDLGVSSVLVHGQKRIPALLPTVPRHAHLSPRRRSPLLDALTLLYEISWSRASPVAGRPDSLSSAEREVMTLMAAGFKDEAIARHLDVTTRTIRRRVQAVLTAMNARSRFEAGVEAARRGLV